MTLVKWTPKPMSLFDEMDNMVSSVFGNDWNFPANHTDWAPAVDVKETDDLFLITADIPGLTKKDVKVNITDGKMTISGAAKVEDNEENEANNQGNGIHINAVSAGSTNFTIQLMHEGHSDYTSMPIAIEVNGN